MATVSDSGRNTISKAKSLVNTIRSFKFIISMEFLKSIYSIITPLSKCLQFKNLYFIQALILIDKAQSLLELMRTDDGFKNLVNPAKIFSIKYSLIEVDFREIRSRRKKQMPREMS